MSFGDADSATAERASTGTLVVFGVGNIAVALKNFLFGTYLMLFYNQVLGLDPILAGSALFVALLVDAVSDPLVGQLSDRLRTRWGRRHPFLYASLVPFALSYYFLLTPPEGLGSWGLFGHLLGLSVAIRLSMTFYDVPRNALGPELTKDYEQRTLLNGISWALGWLGGGIMGFLAFAVFFAETPEFSGPRAFLNPAGYEQMAWVGATLILFSGTVFVVGTHRHIPRLHVPEELPRATVRETLRQMRESLAHRSWLMLFFAGIFFALFLGLTSGFSNYYNLYFWEWTPREIAVYPLVNVVVAIVAALLATPLASGREKKKVAIVLLTIVLVAGPLPLVLRLVDPLVAFPTFPANGTATLWWVLLFHSSLQVALGIIGFVLVGSMVADVVEDSQRRTGRRSEGLFFSAPALIQKAVGGIGVFATGLLLAAAGFTGSDAPSGDPQTAIHRLAAFHVALSFTLPIVSIYLLSRYEITRSDHSRNLDVLGYQ